MHSRCAARAPRLAGPRFRPAGVAARMQFVRRAAVASRTDAKKQELMEAISGLNRGLTASDDDKAAVEKITQALERMNPNKASLEAPEINGKWRLIYTTSDSILGTSRPPFARPLGPIHQYIDATSLKARNNESWPFFNSVTAKLEPMSKSQVFVRFVQFKIFNIIPITAPKSATGTLDTTFVDSELRISRGDKGNLFILEMADPDARL